MRALPIIWKRTRRRWRLQHKVRHEVCCVMHGLIVAAQGVYGGLGTVGHLGEAQRVRLQFQIIRKLETMHD